MSTTFTSSISLAKPGANDRAWNVPLNANADLLDALTALGALAVKLHETPSTTLTVAVSPGTFGRPNLGDFTYAGTASVTVPASQTSYLYLDSTGTLAQNTTGFPSAPHVRLAVVVAGATTITSVTDARIQLMVTGVGTPTVAAGTGAGTSPTVTLLAGSTDRAGTISILTGTSPAGSATVATVTFGSAYPATPRDIAFHPVNIVTLAAFSTVCEDQPSRTATTFTIKVGGTALSASTTYMFGYQVEG